MKKEINPVFAAIAVILIIAVAGFFLWRNTAGTSGPGPMQPGNAGPFSPGGAALGHGGGKPAEANTPKAPGTP